jgi:hypothetical protein
MKPLFADHNIARPAVARLRALGYDIVASREVAYDRANDDETLSFAARTGRILLTHDVEDFELLHDAWSRWSTEWGVERHHAGILILPQEWPNDRKAQEIDAFLKTDLDLTNRLFRWKASTGWEVRPLVSVLS